MPVIPAGTHPMRATARSASGKSSSESRKPRSTHRNPDSSSTSHKARSRRFSNPSVRPTETIKRDMNNRHRARTLSASAAGRPDSLAWPIPSVPEARPFPKPKVSAKIRPAPDHMRRPTAFDKDLRRMENFHLTQSERGDRVRDDESDVQTEVSALSGASSTINDKLRELGSDCTADEPWRRPRLPTPDVGEDLDIALGSGNFRIKKI
ncbi:hypothetical protein BKA67DRAFT_564240 [Truncatella angustata]|uniref:Uncharacterized protein n=1 Tax=Truncatella angustata TaxID=152316 RepID=A0A9P8ZYK6_9PEZI|nr:uncharacterized protein BKA67DRAFT_564240 [Truncatella angustata]KAH6654125.1 hypothetical protein BKA67DRAFT_564240 [Truncatella angustata]